MPLVDEACLKITTHPMEHLELEGVKLPAELSAVVPRGRDHARVVRRDCRVVS